MCRHVSDIARLDDGRYVAQCEHASVLLAWGHCTWHLPPADFLTLAALLGQEDGEAGCFVLSRYEGKSLLWCGDACLVLRGERLGEFRRLVALAAPRLARREFPVGYVLHLN